MACEIDSGRAVGCKSSLGGIKTIYIGGAFEDMPSQTDWAFTADSHFVTAIKTKAFYTFEVRPELSSLVVNYMADAASGTSFFEQVLSCTFQLLDQTDIQDIMDLCQGRPNIWVEDNNLNVMLLGAEYGMNVTGGNIQTGTAYSDMSGYTIDFTGREQTPVWFANAPSDADPFAGVTGASASA